MNSRAFTLSLVIAGIAVFMVMSYIDGREAKFKEAYGNMVPVVVAKSDIRELDLIDDTKVQVVTVPEKYKMPGVFDKEELVYNTIATVPIKKGEQITKPRVTYPGSRTGLARQVSIGKRALAIRISEAEAVSKLIKPGDRVDVLALIDYANGRKEKMKVKTVLQDVYVLATGLNVTKELPLVGMQVDKKVKSMNLTNYTRFNTITLELTPFQVQQMIYLIKTDGAIYVSLRNNDDKAIERVNSTTIFDILGEDAVDAKAFYGKREQKKR
ncbi:MAG: Flp pilus assembly protein CpaB [Bacteriovoracaceae bacterium]|jgi:pilus assembly protein CpaB|nr:Flp pilus assembly protein CpaB [Bacteriovoracaceae bacterium]